MTQPEREPKRTLADRLKDVRKTEPSAQQTPQDTPEDTTEDSASEVVATRLDARLTMSELDAVKRQIERCWSPPAGAKEAGNFAVEIHVSANPDGTVRQARISNSRSICADPFLLTLADTALRAVLTPLLTSRTLPLDIYTLCGRFTAHLHLS